MSSLVLLLGCPKPAAPSYGSHVQVELPQDSLMALPERQRMLVVLDRAAPDTQVCYERELERDPLAYGDASIWLRVGDDGSVLEAEMLVSTLGSSELDACVLDVVRGLEFPSGGVTLRYPFVFTSSLTPPEIRRALMLKHGLLHLDDEALELDNASRDERNRKGQDERGWTESW